MSIAAQKHMNFLLAMVFLERREWNLNVLVTSPAAREVRTAILWCKDVADSQIFL
jgi:hypothetical protein